METQYIVEIKHPGAWYPLQMLLTKDGAILWAKNSKARMPGKYRVRVVQIVEIVEVR